MGLRCKAAGLTSRLLMLSYTLAPLLTSLLKDTKVTRGLGQEVYISPMELALGMVAMVELAP